MTETQFAEFGLTFGVTGFMLYMLFIIFQLARGSKAGKFGTFVFFSAGIWHAWLCSYASHYLGDGRMSRKYTQPTSMAMVICFNKEAL